MMQLSSMGMSMPGGAKTKRQMRDNETKEERREEREPRTNSENKRKEEGQATERDTACGNVGDDQQTRLLEAETSDVRIAHELNREKN